MLLLSRRQVLLPSSGEDLRKGTFVSLELPSDCSSVEKEHVQGPAKIFSDSSCSFPDRLQ
jgi:hypothetical protein